MMKRPSASPLLRLLFALACLVAGGLACNFPSGQPELSPEQLRQTLAASGGTAAPFLQTAAATDLPAAATSGASAEPGSTLAPGITLAPGVTLAPATPFWPATPTPGDPGPFFDYYTQPGDTLQALLGRFDATLEQIGPPAVGRPPQAAPPDSYLPTNLLLVIPNNFDAVSASAPLLPDSELVYSPSAANFDVAAFVQGAGGYLSTYLEEVDEETLSGAAIVQRVATELSVNPRLLLALLEYRAGWVFSQAVSEHSKIYPLGFEIPERQGLYQEVMIAATHLNLGYYGWRAGSFGSAGEFRLRFADGSTLRPNPTLNAGSVALQHLFTLFYRPANWQPALYGDGNFLQQYEQMFGDPWGRAASAGPLLPAGLAQPTLELPFLPGENWSLTAGAHMAWNSGTPRGALDFSPITGGLPCEMSPAWVTASASGLVVRSAYNAVALDLDGDGSEQTGWVLVYMHLADEGRIQSGAWAALDDPLGHPSCEGGRATGKHVHIARKYNGEWLAADGPVPFILSGWRAYAGVGNYLGTLVKDGQVVTSNPGGEQGSTIRR